MLFKSLHLVRSKAQRWNSEKYVKVQNIGQCSQGSLGDAVEDCLTARPAASRNVGKVCEEEVLQRKFVEIKLGGTTNTFREFTELMPGFIETTTFNTYISLGEGLVCYCYWLQYIHFPSQQPPKLSYWELHLLVELCLGSWFLPLSTSPHHGHQGGQILPPSASCYGQFGPVT